MLGTIQHVFSNAIADGTNTQIVRPSDWNSAHNVTLSMQSNDHPVFSAGTSTAYLSSVVFSNASGVSFGLNGSTITASVATNYQAPGAYLTTARGSTDAVGLGTAQTNVTWTVNSAGISFNAGGYNGTGFTSTSTAGVDIKATNNTSGLSMAVPAYITTARGSTDAVGLNTAQTNVTWTVNSGGISFNAGGYNGTGFTSTTTAGTAIVATNNTNGLSMGVPAYLTAGAVATTLQQFMPFPFITGSAVSSYQPASWFFNVFQCPTPVAVSYLEHLCSFNASVPGATSAASTGTAVFSYSNAVSLFTRVNFGANSSQISYLTSASFGLTAGLSYSSTSQSLVVSWVTDSTGGTSSFNTTSNAGNWSNFLTGLKIIRIPFVTTLSVGEYFLAHKQSSTAGTTQSGVTLISVSKLQANYHSQSYGVFSSSGALATNMIFGATIGPGIGSASAVTTNAGAMSISVITVNANDRPLYWQFNGMP